MEYWPRIAARPYQRDEFEKRFTFFMDSYSFKSEQVDKLKRLVKREFHDATIEERKDIHKLEIRIRELDEEQTALIKKNIKGVVNDTVLTQQLSRIEKERLDVETTLASMRNIDVSAEEAVDFSEKYLQAPSSVWKKAGISTQTKLQWFQFPSGITFEREIFRTAEISSVFKAKELISTLQSSRVDHTGFEPVASSMPWMRSTK